MAFSVTSLPCSRTHRRPCNVAGVSTRRRTAPILVVASAAAALALSACTAHMDLTISESDTYDATIVMRDTTGSLLTEDTGVPFHQLQADQEEKQKEEEM